MKDNSKTTRREAVAALAAVSGALQAGAARAQESELAGPREGFSQFKLEDLIARAATQEGPYLRFLNNETMSAGLYELAADAEDRQPVHALDEIYVVMRGRAVLRAGEVSAEAAPGAVLFVAAGVPHRFEAITEDLKVLVFFSKAPPPAPAP